MAISDTINSLKEHIGNAYTAIGKKKGTVPANKNCENLKAAIESIAGRKEEQAKTVTIIENGTNKLLPDEGKTFSEVTVITDVPSKEEEAKEVDLAMASGNQIINPTSGKTLSQVVVKKPATMLPENIKKDVNIGGVTGTLEPQTAPKLQSKTVTPTKSQQSVSPDSGYDGLSGVTVNAIPDNYVIPSGAVDITTNGTHNVSGKATANVNVPAGIDTSDATAVASDILSGKTAYARGMKLTGSIETYDGTFVTNTHKIITNLTNMVADPSNATTIKAGESVRLEFTPTGDYIYPYSVTVTGAESSWNYQNGWLTLTNATSDVTVTINATQVGILGRSKIKFKDRLTKPSSMVSIFVNGTDIKLTDESYSGYYIAEIEMSNSAGWLTLRTRNPSEQLGVNGIVYSTDGFTDGNTGQTYAANQWVVPAAKELVIDYNPLEVDQSDLNWLKANATITKL